MMLRKHWHISQMKVGGIYLENVRIPIVRGLNLEQTIEQWADRKFPEENNKKISYYRATIRGLF